MSLIYNDLYTKLQGFNISFFLPQVREQLPPQVKEQLPLT